MTSKLERLKAKVSNLDEWKFKTAETMYRRLENLLMLCFPTEIAKKINTMREELCTALEAKAAGLNDDMRKALDEKDYQKIDLIFKEVTKATDADSTFVQKVHCFTLNTVLEKFLDTLIASIKNHYEKFEIKEAELKKIDLANLAEKSKFAGNHIAHLKDDLEALAISKKKTMISKDWLKAGDIRKVDGFRKQMRSKNSGTTFGIRFSVPPSQDLHLLRLVHSNWTSMAAFHFCRLPETSFPEV